MDEFSVQPNNQKNNTQCRNLHLFGAYLMQSFVGKYLNAQKVLTVLTLLLGVWFHQHNHCARPYHVSTLIFKSLSKDFTYNF